MNRRHRRIALVLLLAALASSNASAQTSVGAAADTHFVAFRDEVGSAVAYRGATAAVRPTFSFVRPRVRLDLEAAFQSGLLRAPLHGETLALSRTSLGLDAGLLFTTAEVFGWRLRMGPTIENSIATHAHRAGGFVQYTGLFAAGFGVSAEQSLGRHRLRVTTVTPLLGYLVRPPYAMESNELWREGTSTLGVLSGGEFAWSRDVQRATITAGWSWGATHHLSVGAEAGWRWQRIPRPRPFIESDMHLALTLEFHPGGPN